MTMLDDIVPFIRDKGEVGAGTRIWQPSNIYRCRIGKDCTIGAFVTIQEGAVIGDRCKIMDGAFICAGARIGDGVFIGMGAKLCNDRRPRATRLDGKPKGRDDWKCEPPIIEDGASIGANAVILPGILIGAGAVVAAGAVVRDNVNHNALITGNPTWYRRDLPESWGHEQEGDP